MIILGLDPDKGWALAHDHKIISAGTVKGMTEMKKIIADAGSYFRDGMVDFLVRIERPTNLKTFPRPGLSVAAMMKIAQNCGQNYRKATELGEYCASLGLRYEFIAPSRKKYGKMTGKQFNRLTGYPGRTSAHSRDAIMITLRMEVGE